jgi:hypothetical protein
MALSISRRMITEEMPLRGAAEHLEELLILSLTFLRKKGKGHCKGSLPDRRGILAYSHYADDAVELAKMEKTYMYVKRQAQRWSGMRPQAVSLHPAAA